MTKKQRLFAVCLAAGLATGTGLAIALVPEKLGLSEKVIYIHGDYPEYNTLNEAMEAADAVVVVEYISSHETLEYPDILFSDDPKLNPQAGLTLTQEDLDEMAIPVTIARVRVKSSLAGDTPVGSEIEVSQLGGVKDGIRYVDPDTILLGDAEEDSSLLLFLNVSSPGEADLISPDIGAALVEGDKVKPLRAKGGKKVGQVLSGNVNDVRKAGVRGR